MAKSIDPKVLYLVDDPKNYTKIIEWAGKKFQIRFQHSNGDPLGFNYKCALSIMTEPGNWSRLVDNRQLNIEWKNCYVYSRDNQREMDYVKSLNKTAEQAFMKYIMAIY